MGFEGQIIMETSNIEHEEKLTLSVDINIPGHDPRTATILFENSKKLLLDRDGARCFICNATAEESGEPLESHHYPIERSLANMIDWDYVKSEALSGRMGVHAQQFNWDGFMGAIPFDPITFVDDQTVNGLILCKKHHTGKDEGIHDLPHPLWIAQKYGKEGYDFSKIEIIHHNQ